MDHTKAEILLSSIGDYQDIAPKFGMKRVSPGRDKDSRTNWFDFWRSLALFFFFFSSSFIIHSKFFLVSSAVSLGHSPIFVHDIEMSQKLTAPNLFLQII
jgi:hypothetical protein